MFGCAREGQRLLRRERFYTRSSTDNAPTEMRVFFQLAVQRGEGNDSSYSIEGVAAGDTSLTSLPTGAIVALVVVAIVGSRRELPLCWPHLSRTPSCFVTTAAHGGGGRARADRRRDQLDRSATAARDIELERSCGDANERHRGSAGSSFECHSGRRHLERPQPARRHRTRRRDRVDWPPRRRLVDQVSFTMRPSDARRTCASRGAAASADQEFELQPGERLREVTQTKCGPYLGLRLSFQLSSGRVHHISGNASPSQPRGRRRPVLRGHCRRDRRPPLRRHAPRRH